ncbi:alpha/beta fold hydrolase [Rathayibacter soli]|uniref:alpha/beta fold hydrolase n=1 Tax=Rathayibacter soli TaxID=3144168 RepID=UPI0027E4C387|nr:alpha/beta hydrolase [Glaciibacter superstes]
MTEYVTSADGTRIAYDRVGDGPTVILVAGAMQFRGFSPQTVALCQALAARGFTVINYDRRGRGESVVADAFSLARELDDITGLITVGGESAALFGSSSGSAISLAAAAAGLPITKLALWEAPLGEENGADGDENLTGLREKLESGDGDAVIEYYMKDMPREWLDGAKQSPGWPTMVAMGPSLQDDAEALAWTQTAPRDALWARITQPVLAIVGERTLPIMERAVASMIAALQSARAVTIAGANHSWDPEAMVETLVEFFAE